MLHPGLIIDLATALDWRDQNSLFIDVRSPAEYADGHIPGACNVPLLNDSERAAVGTLHKQQGSSAARQFALEQVAPQLPRLIDQIVRLQGDRRRPLVLYCWRGGQRSQAMTAFMQLAGLPAFQLQGGHKAFRRHVVDFFANGTWGRLLVLRGLTGVGKTRILRQLDQQGVSVLDLEGLANHRGSAFGAIGLHPQPSQKQFEALLWERLRHIGPDQWALTEGESRHIGRLVLPLRLYDALQQETTLWLETALDKRVQVIAEDYAVGDQPAADFIPPIRALRQRLGQARVDALLQLQQQRDWPALIAALMTDYYDPLYGHTKPERRIDLWIDPFANQQRELLAAIDRILSQPDNGAI
ncbi:MAG: tRNA 2-selenouridine(34) synthase MnmH [Desulfuromonas thiophila]|jgi:tRNA 2-selenouridine synthase|nr:tRNA 2-selenouridine(34) synthase MnmH [Desulfuromonas thiophila]